MNAGEFVPRSITGAPGGDGQASAPLLSTCTASAGLDVAQRTRQSVSDHVLGGSEDLPK